MEPNLSDLSADNKSFFFIHLHAIVKLFFNDIPYFLPNKLNFRT